MTDANMSYLYTIGAYATLIGVGYALYHVSTQKTGRRTAPATSRGAKPSHQEPRKEDRKKKQRMESFASEAQDAVKAKPRPLAAEEPAAQSKPVAADKPDDGVDNREFAKQLAKAQEGTKFAVRADASKQREKSVKQSRANQISNRPAQDKPPAPVASSTQSSTTGADADDDQSPPSSPPAPAADVSGVGDMLEPTPTGPSVLRVTEPEPQKQKPKPAKAPEKTETKKQRQNRKKAEAAKAAREESEKERKALEEKQRRAARIAEGRAAKDGSQFQAAQQASSAWSQGAPNGASAGETGETGDLHQPLDTLEKPTAKPSTTKQPSGAKAESSWMSSLPSEETQMEMLKDEADDWNTVTTKASKKAAKKPASVSSGDEKVQTQAAAQPKQPAAAPTTKGSQKAPAPQSFGGSFSALTSDGLEVEEEWDV